MHESVEIASLSQLVRVAVHVYIRGETQPAEQPTTAQEDERQAELLDAAAVGGTVVIPNRTYD